MIGIIRNPKDYTGIATVEIEDYELPLECDMGETGKVTLASKTTDDYTNMILCIEELGETFWKISSVEYGNDSETTLVVKDASAIFEDVAWFQTYVEPPSAVTGMVIQNSMASGDMPYFINWAHKALPQELSTWRASHPVNSYIPFTYAHYICCNLRSDLYTASSRIFSFDGETVLDFPYKGDPSSLPARSGPDYMNSRANTYLNGLSLDVEEVVSASSSSANIQVVSLEKAIKSIQQHGGIVSTKYLMFDFGVQYHLLPVGGDILTYNNEDYVILPWANASGTEDMALNYDARRYTFETLLYSTDNLIAKSSTNSQETRFIWDIGQIAYSTSDDYIRIKLYNYTAHGSAIPTTSDYVKGYFIYTGRTPSERTEFISKIINVYGLEGDYYLIRITNPVGWADGHYGYNAVITGEEYTQNSLGNRLENLDITPFISRWESHDTHPTVVVDISEGPTSTVPVYFKDGHTFLEDESYSSDIVSCVHIKDKNSHTYDYYLNSSLELVNDSTAQIAGTTVYKISDDNIASWDAGKESAEEEIEDNVYEHQIKFASDKEYHVGTPVRLMLERATLDTAIDKVWLEYGDDLYHYSCGNLPTTATEKIKATGWTYAKRLPADPYKGQLVFSGGTTLSANYWTGSEWKTLS